MTTTFATQIELDERGTAWIAGTKVKVTEIVLDKIASGSSPEEIHFQHPNLSLAQIHGALTYYYENQDKVDEQIRRGLAESDELAARVSDAEFRRKLVGVKDPFERSAVHGCARIKCWHDRGAKKTPQTNSTMLDNCGARQTLGRVAR